MSIPSYGYLLSKFGLNVTDVDDADLVSVPLGFIKLMLQYAASADAFSEQKYLATHGDVARGQQMSAATHYLSYGYFEGRANPAVEVDERWYVGQYPGVIEESRSEGYRTVREHFERKGAGRGYAPNPQAFEVYQLWERMLSRAHLVAKA